jgi:2,3-bisphosphoglycerate-dependent phosphoglycerate mutase
MELYIIRHGQSTNNVSMQNNQYDREADPPLTELGQKQAEAVATFLASGVNREKLASSSSNGGDAQQGFGITRLFCSPMLRTLQTCQPISRALGLKPEIWIEIHEHGGLYLDYRDERGLVGFPGLSRTQIMTDFADYTVPDAITEQGWWNPALPPEDIAGAQARAIKVAAAIRQNSELSQRWALVTHGTFADCLVKALLDQLPRNDVYFHHYNTAITRIDFLPESVPLCAL